MKNSLQSMEVESGKEIAVLAKSIARVLVVMGLGPMPGTAITVDDDETQCSLTEPNEVPTAEHGRLAFWMCMFSCLH